MKKVYLIGDSIRYGARASTPGGEVSPGYECFVREKLQDIAEVYAPNENCRFAQHTLRFLNKWAADAPAEEIDNRPKISYKDEGEATTDLASLLAGIKLD